jgi:hypothetical protein
MWMVHAYNANGLNYSMAHGFQTSIGSSWFSTQNNGSGSIYSGYVNGISASTITGQYVLVPDGSYITPGYFQINAGYLQFVKTASSSSNSFNSGTRWAVS